MENIIGHTVPEAISYDVCSHLSRGIVGNELGFFFGKLRDAGLEEDRMLEFASSSFRWPKQFTSPNAKTIFAKREKKTSPVKAEASELLNALPVLRVFVMMFVTKAAINESTVQARTCFLMLCKVIDMLQGAARGMVVDHAELHNAIVGHNTYGEAVWVPKNHLSLHLGEFLTRFGHLVWCFTHERKHEIVKRFANLKLDGSKAFEESVLKDVLRPVSPAQHDGRIAVIKGATHGPEAGAEELGCTGAFGFPVCIGTNPAWLAGHARRLCSCQR